MTVGIISGFKLCIIYTDQQKSTKEFTAIVNPEVFFYMWEVLVNNIKHKDFSNVKNFANEYLTQSRKTKKLKILRKMYRIEKYIAAEDSRKQKYKEIKDIRCTTIKRFGRKQKMPS